MPMNGKGEENGFLKENSSTLDAIRLEGITSPINKNKLVMDKAKVLVVCSTVIFSMSIFLPQYRIILFLNRRKIKSTARNTMAKRLFLPTG
jgi:hypothetical protein